MNESHNAYFTFGTAHTTTFPLPRGGQLSDYWVRVSLPLDQHNFRELFVEHFTSKYCPHAGQFAFEYREGEQKTEYFPLGELCLITLGKLCLITEEGLVNAPENI